MAMTGGSVIVNDDGTRTGGGMALALFDGFAAVDAQKAIVEGRAAKQQAAIASVAAQYPPGPERDSMVATVKASILSFQVTVMRYWADQANALGPAMVTCVQQNATASLQAVVAKVAPGTSLGTTPNPTDPGAPMVGPAAAVLLPVAGDAGATELPLT